jgi:arabinosaccharide transport system substrate-binding protein
MDMHSLNVALSRRGLLHVALAGGAALLAACGGAASPTAAPAKPADAAKPADKPADKPAAAPTTAPAADAKPAAAATTAPAAGAATTPAAAKPAAGTKNVELEVWAHSPVLVQWLVDAMKNYNFPNQGLTLKAAIYPFDEAHNKMLAAINSGAGLPAIMRVEQGRFSSFIKGQQVGFVDLTDKIGARRNDLALGSAVDYWSWKGKVYGIGNELNCCALAYRDDLFKEVGAKLPFESWSDFRDASAKLKQSKNINGISWHDQSEGDFQILMFAAGGQYVDESGEFAGASDLGVDVMAMMHEHIYKDKIAQIAPVTGDSRWSPPIYWAAFKEQKIAANIGAPWHNGNLGHETKLANEQSGKWRLQRLPKGLGAGKPTATHGGTSISIPAKAPNQDEAWQVIEFTHLTKAILQDYDARGAMPTYLPALSDPKITKAWDYYGGQKIGELYGELAKDMPRIFQSPWKPEIDTTFRNIVATPILQNANATKNDIKAAFDKLKAEIERVKKL